MNLKEAGKLANSNHVEQALAQFRGKGLSWLLEQTGRESPKFRYSVIDGERVPTKAFGFLVAQIAGRTSNRSNDMTVNEAAAVLKRAAGVVSVAPGSRTETPPEESARLESYYRQLARPGQAAFRKRVMAAFGQKCAISKCDVSSALEAAHVDPFSQNGCDDVSNGLLLRADLHRLFDANHLAIEPATGQIRFLNSCNVHYAEFQGYKLDLPDEGPGLSAFASRWESFDAP